MRTMHRYIVSYTSSNYADGSGPIRRESRIVKANSPEEAQDVLRGMRERGEPLPGHRYIGLVDEATLVSKGGEVTDGQD